MVPNCYITPNERLVASVFVIYLCYKTPKEYVRKNGLGGRICP